MPAPRAMALRCGRVVVAPSLKAARSTVMFPSFPTVAGKQKQTGQTMCARVCWSRRVSSRTTHRVGIVIGSPHLSEEGVGNVIRDREVDCVSFTNWNECSCHAGWDGNKNIDVDRRWDWFVCSFVCVCVCPMELVRECSSTHPHRATHTIIVRPPVPSIPSRPNFGCGRNLRVVSVPFILLRPSDPLSHRFPTPIHRFVLLFEARWLVYRTNNNVWWRRRSESVEYSLLHLLRRRQQVISNKIKLNDHTKTRRI